VRALGGGFSAPVAAVPQSSKEQNHG
jgi:hypothetical protein